MYWSVYSRSGMPAFWDSRIVRSSTSVKFITCRTSWPNQCRRVRRSTSTATKVRKLPMCPRAYTVRPQAYMRTCLPSSGAKGSSCRVKVLKRRIGGHRGDVHATPAERLPGHRSSGPGYRVGRTC